jgi:predicted nucleic acid-binding protein
MSRPALCFVDATILSALIAPAPSSDRALRCLLHVQDSWITSEISVALCLSGLQRRGLRLQHQQACLDALVLLLRHGVGMRPLPLQALQLKAPPSRVNVRPRPLAPLQALQLHTALHWRCRALISNDRALVAAARASGLVSYSLEPPPAAAHSRWETGRRRSPTQP